MPNSHFCHLKHPKVHQNYDRQISLWICALGFHHFLGCRMTDLEDYQGLNNEIIRTNVQRDHCNIIYWLLPRLKCQNPDVSSQQNFHSCIHLIVKKKVTRHYLCRNELQNGNHHLLHFQKPQTTAPLHLLSFSVANQYRKTAPFLKYKGSFLLSIFITAPHNAGWQ